jgi:hypothetical protein
MNNFGGLGINPTEWAWYHVFAVDPDGANHLIAPDVINQKMMQTFDDGDNWTEIPLLTSQVTDNGRLLFRAPWSGIRSQVTAIEFFPDDPNMVAIGTRENGIFISSDRGASWSKVPGSESVPYITSFDWRTADDIIISSYGRGLWRAQRVFLGTRNAPPAPVEGAITAGLVPRRDGTLPGIVFSKAPLAMHPGEQEAANRAEVEEKPIGREESPTVGKPYLEVRTGNALGSNVALPGQTVQIVVRGARGGIEIAIDGETLGTVAVGDEGQFSASVEAPRQFGIHKITIINQANGKVIDGAMLLVRPGDKGRLEGGPR